MKFIIIVVSMAVTTLSAISAVPSGVSIFSRREDTCPRDFLSCSRRPREVDRCCSPEYGLLVLAQQWDTSVGPRNKFTMHGLWPGTCEGKQVPLEHDRPMQREPDTCPGSRKPYQGCDDSRVFFNVEDRLESYPNKTVGFMDQMQEFWPSNLGDNNCFWSHQWIKHGTCVSTLDPSCTSNPVEGKDVYDYFSKALELRSRYDLYRALTAKRIFPRQSGKYKTGDIRAAIKEEFGVEPYLKCKHGNLEEIRLFFKVKNGDQYEPVQPTHPGWMGSCPKRASFRPKD
ncbi:Ribonuclease T2 precursor (RNase T2) [Podila epicladia]|nr:Ribonuclease T2 precursor (RNase T2) [Podila epicladia]KAG0100131.1 Ribonuclease T2 precursor (RNase T2) [Podila epicladia]